MCPFCEAERSISAAVAAQLFLAVTAQYVLHTYFNYFQLGCPSKLVSYRNNRNWNQNQCRHYQKQDVCFGCFTLISKQRVSVFRNNRIKQKTNRNSSKFVKISTFSILYTISSVCFGCLNTGPKHRNKTKQSQKNFWGFAKEQTKKQPKQIEFRFVSVQTEKKN